MATLLLAERRSAARMTDGFPSKVFWVTFLLTMALGTIWALASPLSGVPDEPSHVIRAASVVRGELLGEVPADESVAEGSAYLRAVVRVVEVPGALNALGEFAPSYLQHFPCYAFDPQQHAGCHEFEAGPGGSAALITTAGEHPPVWYFVVGIPSLLSTNAAGVYAMRIVNVLLAAALIGLAAAALGWDRSTFGTAGLLLALTPMVFFLMGGVNSSGPEIAAGMAVWGATLALLRGETQPVWLISIAGVGALALVLVRKPGPLWLLLIVAGALIAVGSPERVRALIGRRAVQLWSVVVAAAVLFEVLWLTRVGTLGSAADGVASRGFAETMTASLGQAYQKQVVETVGFLGWLDLPVPDIAVAAWLVALGGMLVLGILSGARRMLVAALLVASTALLVIVTFEILESGTRFLFWQGRYSMPLLVGVPILLGVAVAEPVVRFGRRRVALLLSALFVAAHGIAFFQYLRRNTVGVYGDPRFLWGPEWVPPLPPWLLFGLSMVVTLAVAWWFTREPRFGEPDQTRPGSSREVSAEPI